MRVTATVIGCVVAMLALGACEDEPEPEPERCTPPDAVTYTCDPLPAGSPGCRGMPTTFGSFPVPDPEAAFPEDCMIRFPACHPYYPTSVASCFCMDQPGVDGGTALAWTCPL